MIKKLGIISLFSGIGAFEKALAEINQDYEILAYCDCSKHAYTAYSQLHKNNITPFTKSFSKIENINIENLKSEILKSQKEVDLISFGFPCKNISTENNNNIGFNWKCTSCCKNFNPIMNYDSLTASKCPNCNATIQLDESVFNNNQSSLLYFAMKFVELIAPNIVICENVPSFASKYEKEYERLLSFMDNLNYYSYSFLLNSKYFGIPQDRNRLYCIFIKKTCTNYLYKLNKNLNKYIKEQKINHNVQKKIYTTSVDIYKLRHLSDFLSADFYNDHLSIKTSFEFNKSEPIKVAHIPNRARDSSRHIYLENGILPTLTASAGNGGNNAIKILSTPCYFVRELTPKEYLLLMGFSNKDFAILQDIYTKKNTPYSKAPIYELAGNSIVVPVLQFLFSLFLY